MGKDIILLLSLLQLSEGWGSSILKVAIKIDKTKEEGDWYEYPREKKSQQILQTKLPLHCRGYEVIACETIFESLPKEKNDG